MWDDIWDVDEEPQWAREQDGWAGACRGVVTEWGGRYCPGERLAVPSSTHGLCAECHKAMIGTCLNCGLGPAAYADGSCRTCYRWLIRNREKYPPELLHEELARRIRSRLARAARAKPSPRRRR
jgi:hypothetical protein